MAIDQLKSEIKKAIYEFTISPFQRHIAIEELEKTVLALLPSYVIIDSVTAQEKIVPLLREVVRKEGAFSRDQLAHAENCLELASKNAANVLRLLGFTEETP